MIDRYNPPEIAKIWTDESRFTFWKDIEVAVCRAQAKLGVIPQEALKNIEEKANFDVNRVKEIEEETNHDVIAFLTNMAEYIGPDSRYVHMGMTSSDLLDTTLALQCREAGKLILAKLNEVIEVTGKQAIKYKDQVMLGRTHGVSAEPITFGLKLALWYTELIRSKVRVERAIENISFGQVSGAVGTFTYVDPEIEELVCEELGLNPAPVSSQIIQRDRHAEYLSSFAILAASIEKFTTEIRNMQRGEIFEVEEPFSKKQKGSSAMPHKRNPITSERLTGMARLVRTNALASLENICLWHERDISHSSVERIILPDSTGLIFYMLHKFKYIVENLRVYPENMERNVKNVEELIFSQGLLLKLSKKQLTREDSYKVVQTAAMEAREKGGSFKERIKSNPVVQNVLTDEEVESCFDTNNFTKNIDYIFKKAGLQ